MDGVERIMVLGIFAVIVAILSIAAWGVTNDDGESVFPAGTDGGLVANATDGVTVPPASGTGDVGRPAERGGSQARGGGAPQGGEQRSAGSGPRKLAQGEDSRARPGSHVGSRPGQGKTPRDPVGPRGPGDMKLSGTVPVEQPEVEQPKPVPAAPKYVDYEVVKGDTVYSIVRKHFGDGHISAQIQLVQQLNPAIDIDNITEGDVIRLPAQVPESLVSKPPEKKAAPGTRLYTIGPGETLTAIAKEQLGDGKRWNEIWQLNRQTIPEPDKVHDGMTILLPVR